MDSKINTELVHYPSEEKVGSYTVHSTQASVLDSLTVEKQSKINKKNKYLKPTPVKFSDASAGYELPASQDTRFKLPVLPPRYHGQRCAMEINVLEKHNQKCRWIFYFWSDAV